MQQVEFCFRAHFNNYDVFCHLKNVAKTNVYFLSCSHYTDINYQQIYAQTIKSRCCFQQFISGVAACERLPRNSYDKQRDNVFSVFHRH